MATIRIINAQPLHNRYQYKNGDVFENATFWTEGGGATVFVEGERVELFDREYVVLGEPEAAAADVVNSPSHYNNGRFETIEMIAEITGGYGDGYQAYCIGNAIKYLSRAPFKHGSPLEDMRKAAKYLEFAIEAEQAKEAA